ncbi:hypothetical protein INT45_004434 [Circinella minor]|uniref:CS domain-containing protein n=1 Tax=Circinella minor TaxID=1195481 RepID=A0A8H7S1U9_9FUNG|nr:hypothetical protein INT45_004434 [Circinella minor]
MAREINYEEADVAELKNLKTLATRPVVINAMEKLLKDCQQHIQARQLSNTSKSSFSTSAIREPISRSKANIQTIYITSGYAWGQSDQSIIEHEGANYNFRISQLHGYVTLENSRIKLKESQLVIYLRKENIGKNWADLRLKTTRDMYDQLKRAESSNTSGSRLVNTSPISFNISSESSSNNSNNTMETIVHEIYQNTDSQTKRKIQESLNQVNKNPFVFEEEQQHQHPL